MVFIRTSRTDAYFSRYQVKRRRRRQGKTDYRQRKKLIVQDKNKYSTPKYRFVVRITNTRVICQVFYSTISGDHVMAAADSLELKRYGLKVGFKNYPAAYCTGLLTGRRVLKSISLDEKYTGVGNDEEDEVTGEIMHTEFNKRKYFVDELDGERRPFKCFLDIGLARTTTGARIFGALKGFADAGVDIPHNPKRFPGYDKATKHYDPENHKASIFGEPIKEYMETLIEEDAESGTTRFQEQFGSYKNADIGPDDLEDMYKAVHKAIRENPGKEHTETSKVRAKAKTHVKSNKTVAKTSEEKLADRKKKLEAYAAKKSAGDDDEEEEEEAEEEDEKEAVEEKKPAAKAEKAAGKGGDGY